MEGSIAVSMRILMGVHGLPPHSVGGAENYALQLAEALAEHSHVVLFAPLQRPEVPEGSQREQLQQGQHGGSLRIVERRLPLARHFRETWAAPAAEQWLHELIEAHRPQLLHLHHLTWLSMRLPELAQQHGLPTLLTLHDYWLHCPRGQRLTVAGARCPGPSLEGCTTCLEDQLLLEHRLGVGLRRLKQRLSPAQGQVLSKGVQWLLSDKVGNVSPSVGEVGSTSRPAEDGGPSPLAPEWQTPAWMAWFRHRLRLRARPLLEARTREAQRCLEHCTLVLSPSRHVGQFFVSLGLEPARVRILPPSPPPVRKRRVPPLPELPLRLGFIGSVIPAKGLHVVLEALRGLPLEQYRLDVVGPAPEVHRAAGYAAGCRRQAEGLPVIFQGPQPYDVVERMLEQLHLLLFPSVWEENAPLVLAEAQARGLWILASDLAGARERLERYERVDWITPGDVDGWRRALMKRLDERPVAAFEYPVAEAAEQKPGRHPDLLPHLAFYQEALKFGSARLKKKVLSSS